MYSNLRRFLSISAAPSSSTRARSLQTATSNTNAHSDNSATTDFPLLPTPATAKDVSPRPRRDSKSVQIRGGLGTRWAALKKKVTSGTPPSTSSSPDNSTGTASYVHKPQVSAACERDGHLDVVVVDRVWGEDPKWSTKSDSNSPYEETRAEDRFGTTNTDPDTSETDPGFWASSPAWFFFRWRIWSPIWGFFRLRFPDQNIESHYVKETWFLRKRLALFSAAFFVINWLLPVILITRPVTLSDAIFYYGVGRHDGLVSTTPSLTLRQVGPAISVPLVLLVIFDYPRDHSFLYQVYLLFAVWSWPVYQVIYMHVPPIIYPSCSDTLVGICVGIGIGIGHM